MLAIKAKEPIFCNFMIQNVYYLVVMCVTWVEEGCKNGSFMVIGCLKKVQNNIIGVCDIRVHGTI